MGDWTEEYLTKGYAVTYGALLPRMEPQRLRIGKFRSGVWGWAMRSNPSHVRGRRILVTGTPRTPIERN